jgi:hypothetical protein
VLPKKIHLMLLYLFNTFKVNFNLPYIEYIFKIICYIKIIKYEYLLIFKINNYEV